MTMMTPDDTERNWLWLAVDKVGHLASFQSFGGPLPSTVSWSLKEAELVDQFISEIRRCEEPFCEGRFCHEHAGYYYPLKSGAADERQWRELIESYTRAASCGVFTNCREEPGEVQYAAPSRPRTIDMLPDQIRRIVVRSRFRSFQFEGLDLITPAMMACIGN